MPDGAPPSTTPRPARLIAVQPKWHARDFISARAFRRWMHAQLHAAQPHLALDRPNLVVLTELNGMPLVLRDAPLAVLSGRFRTAAALLALKHLPVVLTLMVRERVSPIRAVQLARIDANARLYLDTCRDLARTHGVYLACGSTTLPHYQQRDRTLRRHGPGLYNQAILLDPHGQLISATDKVHLTPDEERGGLDLTPGALRDVRVVPTPVGDLGVATSLDAFRADVIEQLEAQGCTVMLQPDANGSPWTAPEGLPPDPTCIRDQPVAWLESAWQVTQRGDSIRYAVNPMCVGNLLDLTFDGQSAITGPAEEAPRARSYVLTPPRPGFLALMPWVRDHADPPTLRRAGQALSARSAHPHENQYRTGVLHADVTLPPSRVSTPPPTPHEVALAAYLRGEATLPTPPATRAARVLWPAALLVATALAARPGRRAALLALTVPLALLALR
ncbi:nitrilase-related carbon-nitrogen hydrolase [Deinococcus maricopensis]|uniref:Nitrilase/cyanide hydratase and apolipoprotein N-acyltransferase n=1 Tax=Deinococcus maricopensis (strain DSM 21211 / LMG 22137 / NRRL B-23946 / LB-34) TaxID=709986 RepID=E8U5C1_DEIML|nr:nitrilase-related carbon-nitrogen hydrolase [Deinococcus maricopensis]ADV66260.1 Nitrilase/cyanide hydratase and apolipoprotein N-acyltransferase [Deinococcus maricopensis DSM 21211]